MKTLEKVADENKIGEIASKTIFVGRWSSRCGNCGKGASPSEHIHQSVLAFSHGARQEPGCGIRWEYISPAWTEFVHGEDRAMKKVKELRPDLKYAGWNYEINGDKTEHEFVIES